MSLREKLASLAHEQWSGWTRWMIDNFDAIHVENWERQIATPYAELSEREKDSDRKEADKILAIIAPVVEKARKWDRLTSITEPLAITPLLEDWHDTFSTTCPCLPLVIGNVIVHIGGGCSFGGKEDGKHE